MIKRNEWRNERINKQEEVLPARHSGYNHGDRSHLPGFESVLHHLLAMLLDELFTSLELGFLIFKMGLIIVPTSYKVAMWVKWINTDIHEHLEQLLANSEYYMYVC